MQATAPFDQGLFDFTLRYQRTPGAQYHVRPLSLLQQDLLYRCDGRVTIADLSDATLTPHPEIRAALTFLSAHGLIKTLMPEAWLFKAHPAAEQPLPKRERPAHVSLGLSQPSLAETLILQADRRFPEEAAPSEENTRLGT